MFRGAAFVRCCGVDAKAHTFITGYAILISVDIKGKLPRGTRIALSAPFVDTQIFQGPDSKNLLVDVLGV